MKQTFKILLMMLALVLVLGFSVLPVFAEGADAPKEENGVDFLVKETVEINGEVIYILEDGTAYNSTTKQWQLPEKEGLSFETDVDRMVSSLQYMWKGMLCIFIVIGVIILSVYALNAIFGKIDRKKEQQ